MAVIEALQVEDGRGERALGFVVQGGNFYHKRKGTPAETSKLPDQEKENLKAIRKAARDLLLALGENERLPKAKRVLLNGYVGQWMSLVRATRERKRPLRALSYVGVDELATALSWLDAAAEISTGRPRKDLLLNLMFMLAKIYHDACGEWPTRTFDAYAGKETGRFAIFVAACLDAIDPGQKVPHGLIRGHIYVGDNSLLKELPISLIFPSS